MSVKITSKFQMDKEFVTEILQDMKNFQEDETFVDLTFHCIDGPVFSHQAMMGGYSTLLRQFFRPEKEAAFVLPEVRADDLTALVTFLYTGTALVRDRYEFEELVDYLGIELPADGLSLINIKSSTQLLATVRPMRSSAPAAEPPPPPAATTSSEASFTAVHENLVKCQGCGREFLGKWRQGTLRKHMRTCREIPKNEKKLETPEQAGEKCVDDVAFILDEERPHDTARIVDEATGDSDDELISQLQTEISIVSDEDENLTVCKKGSTKKKFKIFENQAEIEKTGEKTATNEKRQFLTPTKNVQPEKTEKNKKRKILTPTKKDVQPEKMDTNEKHKIATPTKNDGQPEKTETNKKRKISTPTKYIQSSLGSTEEHKQPTRRGILKCFECNLDCETNKKLQTHLCLNHFTSDLQKINGNDKNICSFCNLVFRNEGPHQNNITERLVQHLGIFHEKLWQVVPAEYIGNPLRSLSKQESGFTATEATENALGKLLPLSQNTDTGAAKKEQVNKREKNAVDEKRIKIKLSFNRKNGATKMDDQDPMDGSVSLEVENDSNAGEQSDIDAVKKNCCFKCNKQFKQIKELRKHFSQSKCFLSNLLTEVNGGNESHCSLCNQNFKKSSYLSYHLGEIHNKLKDVLPLHVRDLIFKADENVSSEEEPSTNIDEQSILENEENVKEKYEKLPTTSHNMSESVEEPFFSDSYDLKLVKRNECYKCMLPKRNLDQLRLHLCLEEEFVEHLKGMYNEDECKFCGKTVADAKKSRHTGVIHKKLHALLPKDVGDYLFQSDERNGGDTKALPDKMKISKTLKREVDIGHNDTTDIGHNDTTDNQEEKMQDNAEICGNGESESADGTIPNIIADLEAVYKNICFRCKHQEDNLSNLRYHLCFEFQDQLIEMNGGYHDKCQTCDKPQENDLEFHLGVEHRNLLKLLPIEIAEYFRRAAPRSSKQSEKRSLKRDSSRNLSKEASNVSRPEEEAVKMNEWERDTEATETSETGNPPEELPPQQESSAAAATVVAAAAVLPAAAPPATATELKCEMCQRSMTGVGAMQNHYCLLHFTQELLKFFPHTSVPEGDEQGGNEKMVKCGTCNANYSEKRFPTHAGVKHRGLLKLLPPEITNTLFKDKNQGFEKEKARRPPRNRKNPPTKSVEKKSSTIPHGITLAQDSGELADNYEDVQNESRAPLSRVAVEGAESPNDDEDTSAVTSSTTPSEQHPEPATNSSAIFSANKKRVKLEI